MNFLGYLALRYLAWLIGLRILYIMAVNYLGLPNALATTVILAAVPAMDIAVQASRRASVPMELAGWAKVWGVMVCVYLCINVLVPALLLPAFRGVLEDPSGAQLIALTSVAVAAMLALFLWIGSQFGGR